MSDSAPPPTEAVVSEGVRQRRNRETREAIHRAALELDEQCGVRELTVAQIAERAGVSRRTFFRYYATKEQSILPGHQRYFEAIGDANLSGDTLAEILDTIERLGDHVLVLGGEPELREHESVNRLIFRDAALRAYAVTQDLEITERLAERLIELNPRHDRRDLGLLADIAVASWRRGWIRWSTQNTLATPGAPEETPRESHRLTRLALRRLLMSEA